MRIGIDCRTILNPQSGERAGVGHYTYNLVRALLDNDRRNEYVLFFDYRMPREATQEFIQANTKIKFFPFSSYSKFLPFAYSHMLVAAALTKERLDVFHAPANVAPLTYPRKVVLTVHDLAIYRHPEWFPKQFFSTKLLVPRSLIKAKRVIAVSEATKQDLQKLFKVPAKKIIVVPEAANTELLNLRDKKHNVRAIYGLPKKYVLYVGTIEPRKNIPTLLQAWKRLVTKYPTVVGDLVLVISGGTGYGGQSIISQIHKMELENKVVHTGYITHNHKILLIRQAVLFVFPTYYEGFGLPVLEAMQLGIPVVSTKTSSIPEVAGKAALLVSPNDFEELAGAIKKALTDRRLAAQMKTRGLKKAKEFSWTRTAKETLAAYKSVATKK